MICPGYKRVVCLLCINVALWLASWAEGDGASLVMSVAQTNRVTTWEGEFNPSEIVLFHTNKNERLYVGIYRSIRSTCEGTPSDVYALSSNVVRKVLAANVNVKGVSPVLLSIGHSTNHTFCTYWFFWRHPGNGGLKRFEEYAYTNGVFDLVREFEYGDFGEGKYWYLVDGENYSIMTNFNLCTEGWLWINERTRYRQ